MALYIPHSIFHLARLLYVRPGTFGTYYVAVVLWDISKYTNTIDFYILSEFVH